MNKLRYLFRYIADKFILIIISVSIFLLPPLTKYVIANQQKSKIHIIIKGQKLTVELADTSSKRAVGLMYREKLDYNEGMLFIFPNSQRVTFWMKNTKLPLSLAYINEKGEITEILDLEPYDLSFRKSKYKVKYAIEVNQGWFGKNGIKAGDKIDISKLKQWRAYRD
ncbi:MAG: hypothetical protein A2474_08075 [Elusimicrobia bacterium RIFOXYC2_FULL_34_12]|nr:MAG: hypothetical protein A2474_08075 [Elusimicrobia bacterium RIFOXYC2_FULL_34_12]OGS39441.1 MAG: hypothetical protein A2551_07565 [Elusimicrobia bacterium RIFOXYD2_FULL_34_30]HAM39245.1 hypothetical protein [Elusimicrobiota bacterium]